MLMYSYFTVILHKKGSIVICLLLVIGAISGTKLSSRTCSGNIDYTILCNHM